MIRYPGSKDKIAREIVGRFPDSFAGPLFQSERLEYREPFFGGGAVGFVALEAFPSHATVWINDKDYGMAALWKSVLDSPDELISLVQRFQPTVDAFYRFKEEDGRIDLDPLEVGFRKFALHQISFSGLGAMAGGPIGGRRQSSAFNVHCRWNPDRHCLSIRGRHRSLRRFRNIKITSGDFGAVVADAPGWSCIYADPPYYEKGGQLYKHSMSDDDHRRLASALRECAGQWVLSYDDVPFIRDLYSWAHISGIALTYTTAVARLERRKNSEIVIVPPDRESIRSAS